MIFITAFFFLELFKFCNILNVRFLIVYSPVWVIMLYYSSTIYCPLSLCVRLILSHHSLHPHAPVSVITPPIKVNEILTNRVSLW